MESTRTLETPALDASGRVRVLLVEDNPGDVRLFRELLRDTGAEGFEIEVIGRLSDACARVAEGGIGLVLLDLSLPDSHGLETFQVLHRAAPAVPVIVLSGLTNEAVAVQAVHEGAQDYLVKGVGDGHLLVRAMQYAIERSNAARQVAAYAEELRRKNAQMEADLSMARELQLRFLPQQYPSFPPDVRPDETCFQFVHRYRPAAEVSGDFFTVLPLNEGTAGVFICDVMGHGLRAALLTAVLRGVMEEVKGGALHPPGFLGDISRSFYSILQRTDETILATGFYLVADAPARQVRFSCAGHLSPLRLNRKTGEVRLLQERKGPRGPALGLFPETVYPEVQATFEPGEVLLFHTDGVLEAATEQGEEFGLERLREVVQRHGRESTEAIFDAILAAVQAFTGTATFEDDVCLVGLEFVRPWPEEHP
jgi:serine phosphatase RsbU (regulator of sigma subunit)